MAVKVLANSAIVTSSYPAAAMAHAADSDDEAELRLRSSTPASSIASARPERRTAPAVSDPRYACARSQTSSPADSEPHRPHEHSVVPLRRSGTSEPALTSSAVVPTAAPTNSLNHSRHDITSSGADHNAPTFRSSQSSHAVFSSPSPSVQAAQSSSSSARSSASSKTYYSMEEIGRHNTSNSCWLIVRGRVYDVTSFISKHPGGSKAILRHAGTDSTEDFDFHSRDAQKMWAEFHIGYVEGYKADWQCSIQ